MSMLWFPFVVLAIAGFVETDITAVNSLNKTDIFYDMEFKFIREIEGAIVLADPENACSNIIPPPSQLLHSSINFFVLIEGTTHNCSFYDKIRHALNANYSAAVIYYPGNDNQLQILLGSGVMGTLWRNNITSVLISQDSGNSIKESYLYSVDPGSRLLIRANSPNIVAMLLVFAVIAGVFLLLMFLFLIIRYIQQCRHRNRYRISSRHLKQLPTERYNSNGRFETCAICLEDYKEKDRLRILPCSHAYHCKCIDPWLTDNRRTCPVCKQKVSLSGVHNDEDTSESDTEGRAETAPLIRGVARSRGHGTFAQQVPISVHSPSNLFRGSSGEGTSRDVPSEALDETYEEGQFVGFRASSLPNIMTLTPEYPAIAVPSSSEEQRARPSEQVNTAEGAYDNRSITDNSHDSSAHGGHGPKTVLIV